jgi:cell division protein FtsB
MRSFHFGILSFVLLSFLIWLQYHLWIESGGVIDMLRLKKQVALQTQENDRLKKRNEKLIQQIQYLQANDDAVESRARSELGMVKKGETFYQVVKQ